MKKSTQILRCYAPLLLCTYALVVIAGCAQNQPPSVKETRAIAAENISLRKQLERRRVEIDMLKEKHSREVQRLEKRIEDYRKQRDEWREKAQQNVRSQTKDVADTVMAENAKLRAENELLKEQIAELQKEP